MCHVNTIYIYVFLFYNPPVISICDKAHNSSFNNQNITKIIGLFLRIKYMYAYM